MLAGVPLCPGERAGVRVGLPSRPEEAPIELGPRKSEVGTDQGFATASATESVVEHLRQRLGLRSVRIHAWTQLRGPVAFGIFRPTVAVPADFETRFTSVQREAMLAHELAHLANRDPLWLLVAELVCALAWWHPAVWWARRQFRAACESAADEASTLVPGGRVALAEALVNFGRELTAPGGVGVAGSGLKSELARRVRVLVEGTGDNVISRPAGVWLVRCGIVVLFGASLLAPWPGDRGGLGVAIAAAWAEGPKSPSKSERDVPASPPMPATEDARDGAATRSIDPIRPGLAYDQPLPGSSTRPRGSYVALEQRGPNSTLVFPSFQFPGESLGQAVERISAAARRVDPAGHGIKVSLFGASDLSAVRIGRAGTLRNADLSLVLATLVQAAETPIQSALEGDLVTIAPLGMMSAQGQVALATAADELKAAKRNWEAARAANAVGAPELVAAEHRQEAAKQAFHDLAKRTQSATRQFAVNGPAFRQHLTLFLAPGETNLQAAIRIFCATNGVEIPPFTPTATVTAPPPEGSAAFFDEAQGRLFVRATLADLERIEAAIQQLNLPPAEQHALNLDRQRARLLAALDRIVIPNFEVTDETLGSVVRRLEQAAKEADPQGRGMNFIINEPDDTGALAKTVIKTIPPLQETKITEVIAQVVAGAEKRIQADVESYAVVFNAWRDDSKQLHTRRFAGLGPAFQRHIGGFLTQGQTNLQVAVRAFGAANGVEFQDLDAKALADIPPQGLPAVFYNDRTGILFVRATLVDLGRIDQAIQRLNFPAEMHAGTTRAALEQQLIEGEATLAKLRTRYLEAHPKMVEALARQADTQAALKALSAEAPTAQPVPHRENSALIQTLERDRQVAAEEISRLRQDLENGTGVRSELEAKLKRLTDVEAKIKEQLGHMRQAANGGGRSESDPPQVQLSVFFAEITEGSADDIGLDWLFGQARTNNPALESGLVTNLPAGRTPLNGDRLRVDRLAVSGQSAVLSAEQFTALKERLEGRNGVDFLTAPKVTTLSGRQAQVTVGEPRTLVTGVVATDGSPTNDASVSYVTDQVSVGPLVDLFPAAEGTGWRVKVVASVTEFLGYDDPGATNRVLAQTFGGKPLKGTAPLPRLRMRETQAEVLAHGGETIALRGPLADEVIRFKDKVPVLGDIPMLGRLFRSEGRQVRHKRLYVFIQPVSIDAAGNRQPAPETK